MKLLCKTFRYKFSYEQDILNINYIYLLKFRHIIPLIFSDTYIESINITKILSFSIFFVFLGVVNEHWYVTKNLQVYALYVSFGALLNIILNYILISNFGLKGAAYATVYT